MKSKNQNYKFERERRLLSRSINEVKILAIKYGRNDLRIVTIEENRVNKHLVAIGINEKIVEFNKYLATIDINEKIVALKSYND